MDLEGKYWLFHSVYNVRLILIPRPFPCLQKGSLDSAVSFTLCADKENAHRCEAIGHKEEYSAVCRLKKERNVLQFKPCINSNPACSQSVIFTVMKSSDKKPESHACSCVTVKNDMGNAFKLHINHNSFLIR